MFIANILKCDSFLRFYVYIGFISNDVANAKKKKLNLENEIMWPKLPIWQKNNSKWIIDLNTKCKTINLLEKYTGENV